MVHREAIPLVCPACRVPDAPDGRRESRLAPRADDRAACPQCGATYPVTDDVTCVPPDLEALFASQGSSLAPGALPRDPADGDFLDELGALDPATDAFVEARLLGLHAAAQHPEACGETGFGMADTLAGNVDTLDRLDGLVRSAGGAPDAPVPAILDVGCGPGRLAARLADAAPAGSVGLDIRVAPLRLAARVAAGRDAVVGFLVEGRRFTRLAIRGRAAPGPIRFVQGDVAAPPFPAESFATVTAISLLDTVRDPLLALGQLDALLAPGGLLLVASPWQWNPTVTPPAWWLSTPTATSGEALCAALAGRHPGLPHLAYDLLEHVDLPWALPGNARVVHRYMLETVLARKRAPA